MTESTNSTTDEASTTAVTTINVPASHVHSAGTFPPGVQVAELVYVQWACDQAGVVLVIS